MVSGEADGRARTEADGRNESEADMVNALPSGCCPLWGLTARLPTMIDEVTRNFLPGHRR